MHLEILPIEGLPQIKPGDDLIALLGECDQIQSSDILVVTKLKISWLTLIPTIRLAINLLSKRNLFEFSAEEVT